MTQEQAMANYYTQAVVWPLVPLTDSQKESLDDTTLSAEETEDLYYLYAEEQFGEEELEFLQDLLEELPEAYQFLVVEYANTASKMRPDGFGGGAHILLRECSTQCLSMSTGQWIDETMTRLSLAYPPGSNPTGRTHRTGEVD